MLLLPVHSEAELLLLQKALEAGSRLRVYWVTLKARACPCCRPPLKCTLSVCLSLRRPRECGRGVRTALPLQDAGLLQPGGPAAAAFAVGGLLPGHQGAREHRAEQEGNSVSSGPHLQGLKRIPNLLGQISRRKKWGILSREHWD